MQYSELEKRVSEEAKRAWSKMRETGGLGAWYLYYRPTDHKRNTTGDIRAIPDGEEVPDRFVVATARLSPAFNLGQLIHYVRETVKSLPILDPDDPEEVKA